MNPSTTPLAAHLSPDRMELTACFRDPETAANRTEVIRLGQPNPLPVVDYDTPARCYAIANRRIPLAGATNFRDAGGYATTPGWLPWRSRYRSENLARLTRTDWQTLLDAGIKLVLDLRTDAEVEEMPSRTPSGIEVKRLPVSSRLQGFADPTAALFAGKIPSIGYDDMVEMYLDTIETSRPQLDEAVHMLSNYPEPMVVHCTAGKDRTGIAIALWQLQNGVSMQQVVEDYRLSALLRTTPRFLELRHRIDGAGVVPRLVHSYFSAPVPALIAALGKLTT